MTIKNFSVKNGLTAGNITLNATTNAITTSGNITVGNANLGNAATANFFIGDGGLLSNITISAGSSITNGNSNVIVDANSNVRISVEGTANVLVISSSEANLTGNLKATNANLGNAATANFFIGDGGLLSNISASSGSSIVNGNSNVVVGANANVTISSNGTANVVVVSDTGANITGTANISGNLAAANANLGNSATANFFIGSGNNLSNIQGSNVTGAVGLATYATTANSVAGGNVSGQVGNALIAGTVYTNAQPNITSVGTLTSLSISGNIDVGNVNTGIVSASGNITGLNANLGNAATANFFIGSGNNLSNIQGSNVTGAVSYATTANSVAGGNVSGQVGNALIAGTVYTNAQPNITSVGTLSSLSVSGNIDAGNVNTGIVSATGNITGSNIVTSGVINSSGTSQSNIAGNLSMNSKNIINLADPVNPQDAATKNYVDAAVTGLHVHDSCYVATTGTLATASGGSTSYNNGTSGVGATISTTGTFLLIDGGNVQTIGTRILVKNESNAVWNGVYTYTNTTTLTRATDFDTTSEAAGGDFVFVTSGSTQADTGWVQTTDNPVIGTDNIIWQQFSGAGTYTAGTGLTLTGTVFSVNVAQPQITSVGTLTSLSVSGNINAGNVNTGIVSATGNITVANANLGNAATANFFIGAGNNLSNIQGSNVSGAVSSATTAGTVTTAAQPNITSVGTLTSLSVTGNANVGNVNTANVSATGNIEFSGANVSLGNVSNLKITGGTANFVLKTDGTGNLSWTAQSGGSAAGNTTELQFNNAGSFAGTPGVTYDSANSRLSLKNYSFVASVLGSVSGSTTINVNLGTYVTATVTGSVTWTFTNPATSTNASGFILELTNGGSAAQIWPASVKWPSATAPTLTASGVDLLSFITDDAGTTWRGVASMIDSR